MHKAPGGCLPGALSWSVLFLWLLLPLIPLAGNIVAAGRVAVAAVGFDEFISDIDRMNEFRHALSGRDVLLGLVEDVVTDLAILGNYLSIGALMFVVMAAETAGSIEVTDVVRVGAPLDFHLREIVLPVNELHVLHGLVDGRTLLLRDLRVVFGIVGRDLFGY